MGDAKNSSTHHEGKACILDHGELFLFIGYCIVFIIGTIGNSIVLAVLWKFWRKGPMLELLILYLAVFDLFSSVLSPLLFSYWIFACNNWSFGFVSCKIFPTLVRVLSNLSLGFLIIMALDRYRAICTPFKERFTRRFVHKLAFITCCLCIAWEIPYIYFLHHDTEGCYLYYIKHFDSLPETILILFRDLGFIVIMVFTTFVSCISLRKTEHRHQLPERCGRIICMLLCMAIVLCVTILPRDLFHLTHEISYFLGVQVPVNGTVNLINSTLKLLQTSNSIWNIFIYAGKHDHFWSDARRLLSCHKNNEKEATRHAPCKVNTAFF